MKRLKVWIIAGVILGFILPGVALAGGDKASELIVVADTRVLTEGGYYTQFMHYMAIMARTGLDLKSRKILEH